MPVQPSMNAVVSFLFLDLLAIATICISFCNGGSNSRGCIESERKALLRFKQDLNDPSNRLASWTGDGNCCKWSGVVCHNLTGHVLELHLNRPPPSRDETHEEYERSKLGGKMNPSLLDLKHLLYLDLSGSNFEVQIPQFLGSIRNLRYLNLSRTGFLGVIPNQLGNLSNLEYLDLSQNDGQLYVENLQWLSGVSSLQHLDLSDVNLNKSSEWLKVIHTLPSLVVLKLQGCGLHQFPPLAMTNFSSLATLDLSHNYFGGPIPDGLQNMTSLVFLYLSYNNFSSSIPNWFYKFSHVEELLLDYNILQGSMDALGNLTSIRKLDLSFNRFEGGIPISFGNLCSLRSIGLSGVMLNQEISEILNIFSICASDVLESLELVECQVYGHLSNQLRKFRRIKSLLLAMNSVSGPVPSSLGELFSMKFLNLSYNKLNGTLSEMHFANLTRLLHFDASGNSLKMQVSPHWIPPFNLSALGLSSCQLGPQFPSWLSSQGNLFSLDLSYNRISDTIPTYLFKFSLLYLNLSYNQIEGEIPNLTDSVDLQLLDLSSNNLSGSLPLISSNLYALDLSKNSLSGTIFHFLCYGKNELESLTQILVLSENFLYGELPDCWMKWHDLKVLCLADNRFTGFLPISIGTLSSLRSLHLQKNHLFGSIPESIKNCTNLLALDIGQNEFDGKITSWIGDSFSKLMILNLRSNKFYGLLPIEICRLYSLQILDLAYNNFSGTLPRCISNFSAMTINKFIEDMDIAYGSEVGYFGNGTYAFLEDASLVIKGRIVKYDSILKLVKSIDLSRNNFSGEIPIEVTKLEVLQSLNLSHNHFTGRIPQSIGVMSSLESIDLSENKLSGEIPHSISNLTFLSHLNLSNNNLIGKIPLSTQLQGFDASSFTGNELCGLPLPKDCTASVPGPDFEKTGEEDDNKHEVNWFYVSMAPGFVVGFWCVIGPLLINRKWRYRYCLFLDRLGFKFCGVLRQCW